MTAFPDRRAGVIVVPVITVERPSDMAQRSAGILLFRWRGGALELLLVHPGGPFWRDKDTAAWSIPKGLCAAGEDDLTAAQREFHEETGATATGPFIPLGTCRQASGKTVVAWAVEGDFDPTTLVSNTFVLEWPPRSGRHQEFPEVDRAAWFEPAVAVDRITPGQRPIIARLLAILEGDPHGRAAH